MLHMTVVNALEPWVGRTAADTCVRATAISTGTDVSQFGTRERAELCANVRRLLAPIAPSCAVEAIIIEIEAV